VALAVQHLVQALLLPELVPHLLVVLKAPHNSL